jgi:rod shape determining protein RodA
LILSLVLAGIIYAYYIFRYKSSAILIIYLFLLGSVLFVYSVDYAFNNILEPHQQKRISIVLGLESDPYGTGYNVNQSLISIGSGGFAGKGFLQGTQTKFKFVPEQSTDFIFCTVGEEWGFLGSLVVIGMFIFLLIRLIFLAERQRSSFSRIYGYGVVSILLIHFLINIGMTIGLMPVIGIPLPFFSYGGSSLWGFTILLFIFLRLDASRTEYMA